MVIAQPVVFEVSFVMILSCLVFSGMLFQLAGVELCAAAFKATQGFFKSGLIIISQFDLFKIISFSGVQGRHLLAFLFFEPGLIVGFQLLPEVVAPAQELVRGRGDFLSQQEFVAALGCQTTLGNGFNEGGRSCYPIATGKDIVDGRTQGLAIGGDVAPLVDEQFFSGMAVDVLNKVHVGFLSNSGQDNVEFNIKF